MDINHLLSETKWGKLPAERNYRNFLQRIKNKVVSGAKMLIPNDELLKHDYIGILKELTNLKTSGDFKKFSQEDFLQLNPNLLIILHLFHSCISLSNKFPLYLR